MYLHLKSQRTRVAKQRLLEAAARVANEAGGQLAGAVLQLLGGCGRTHSPAAILEVGFHTGLRVQLHADPLARRHPDPGAFRTGPGVQPWQPWYGSS